MTKAGLKTLKKVLESADYRAYRKLQQNLLNTDDADSFKGNLPIRADV